MRGPQVETWGAPNRIRQENKQRLLNSTNANKGRTSNTRIVKFFKWNTMINCVKNLREINSHWPWQLNLSDYFVFVCVSFFIDPAEAKGFGENETVAQGVKKTFSCPVDGIPKPNVTWYRGSGVSGMPIFIGERLEARDTGCYTCAASNSLGTSISITQCLTVGKPFFLF